MANGEQNNQNNTSFWSKLLPNPVAGIQRRMSPEGGGQSLGGAYLAETFSNLPIIRVGKAASDIYSYRPAGTPQELLYQDPVAAREQIISGREAAGIQKAQQDYNRQMAAFTGGYSPIAERQMQAAQEAWNRALGQVAGEQGAISGLASQSGRDYRTSGTNVNIGAQRAMTGAGTLPATGVSGLGGVTGVQAADLAAQAGQAANIQGSASQAALQARAGQMGGLNQLLAAQAAASQQQMAANQMLREQAMGQALLREQISAERAAEQAASSARADFELHRITVSEQTPFWKREWRLLSKDDKKKLAAEEGVETEQDYLTKKSAEAWALGQMAQG